VSPPIARINGHLPSVKRSSQPHLTSVSSSPQSSCAIGLSVYRSHKRSSAIGRTVDASLISLRSRDPLNHDLLSVCPSIARIHGQILSGERSTRVSPHFCPDISSIIFSYRDMRLSVASAVRCSSLSAEPGHLQSENCRNALTTRCNDRIDTLG
jgi:hypothetical protein